MDFQNPQVLIAIAVFVVFVLMFVAVAAFLVLRKKRKRCGCAPGCETPTPFTSIRNVNPKSNSYAVDCDEVQAYVNMRAASLKREHELSVARNMRALADTQLADEDAEAEEAE